MDGTLDLGVAEEDLDGAQISGALVDLACFGAPERMRAVTGWVETDAGDPFLDQALVLPRGDVGAGADADALCPPSARS